MKKIKLILLSVAGLVIAGSAFAQTDAASLDHARGALDLTHNCDEALHAISLVSIDGRSTPEYLLCMARAQDCKTNIEQAIYYYTSSGIV